MSNELVDAYVDAWLKHTAVSESPEGQANLDALLALLSPDIVYEDVPSATRHEGHEGVTEMCRMVSGLFDMNLDVTSRQSNGEHFAFEYVGEATMKATGVAVPLRAVAIGTFKDGKVASHSDYYDRSAFAPQAGQPAPDAS